MSKKFSHVDDELLINQVREFPSLYNHEHKDFKGFQIRENIWKKIGEVLGKNVEDCKSRWKHIRDKYLKQKRKLKMGTGSASSTRPTKWPLFEHLKFLELVKAERSGIENCDSNQNEETQDSYDLYDSFVGGSEPQNPDETEHGPISPESMDYNPKRIKLSSKSTRPPSDTPQSRSSTPSTSSAKAKLLHNLEERSHQRMQILSQLANQRKEDDDVDLFMRSIALTIKKLPTHLISQAKLQILTLVTNLQASGIASQTTTATQKIQTSTSVPSRDPPVLSGIDPPLSVPSDLSCSSAMPPDNYMPDISYTFRILDNSQ